MNDVMKRLDAIAAKLGVAANHIWGVLVYQARVDAIEWIIWGVLWLAIAGSLVHCAQFAYSRKDDSERVEKAVTLGGIAIVFTLLGLGCLSNILTNFLNPEYWAFKQLTAMLGAK